MQDGEEIDRMPPNSTQNLNAKLSLRQVATSASAAVRALASSARVPAAAPRRRNKIVGGPSHYRGGYHLKHRQLIAARGRGRPRRPRQNSSASLVKAMLMVAYAGPQGRATARPCAAASGSCSARWSGSPTTTPRPRSTSGSASTGSNRLAHRAGMRQFAANPVWGGCQVTARDQARFFARIRSLLPRRHRKYGLGLLRRIVSYERWGIPPAQPRRLGPLLQGRLVPGRRRLAGPPGRAAATRGPPDRDRRPHPRQPDLEYGAATISGVTSRLLRGYR